MIRTLVILLAAAFYGATPSWGQMVPSSSVVTVTPLVEHAPLHAGASTRLLVKLAFAPHYHGQSHTPSLDSLIPTELTLEAPAGISVGRIAYPEGSMVSFSFSDRPLSVYEGEVALGATVAVDPSVEPGSYELSARLTVQACDDKSCLPPSTIPLTIPITVVPDDVPTVAASGAAFADAAGLFNVAHEGSEGSRFTDTFEANGLLLSVLLVFVSGLALNLTPCIYPLIPITVSYFGGKGEQGKGGLILRALLYLLGMAVMYSTLGLFAALTGSLFGAILQHTAVILFIVAVMVGLALSMFGLWDMRMPRFLSDMGGKNREGALGSFVMGLTVGIVAAPCIGPFVLGLLTFVGERQDPVLGFTLFFVLALGLGAPLVILALFSGGMSALPRSGGWMIWVKQVFGCVLLFMGLFFAEPLIPEGAFLWLAAGLLAGSGLFLGLLSSVKAKGTGFIVVKGIVALVFIALAAAYVATPAPDKVAAPAWVAGTTSTVDAALASGKTVIIDFSATWCLPCK
ncbi:MAG: sulfite exporter TauE/SafE family protein, partial [Nitrospinae bacterium]|nr:sulfite exporter TauE/SafE family protein [Nitrospinota bacterium]